MTSIQSILGHKGDQVFTIETDATVYGAIERMAEHNIGALVVMDGNTVAGIVTERDYLRDIALKGRSSRATAVSEIMSSPVVFARPEDNIKRCMEVMTEHRFRHLPVMGNEGLVGVISIGDLISRLVSDQDAEIQELQDYVQGKHHN